MSINVFHLPDLGEGLTEAEILHWLVAEGDTVAMDQPIVEVETAKSAVEIPSPFEGTVHKLHGSEGETLTVGQELISVSDGMESPATPVTGPQDAESPEATHGASYRDEELAGTTPTAEPAAEQGVAQAADDSEESSGNVLIGYGTTAASAGRRRRRKRDGPQATDSGRLGGAAGAAHDAMAASPRNAPTVISPLVRKLAREYGIDITLLQGSGPGGLIMRQDIMQAIEQGEDQRRRSDSAGPAPVSLGSTRPGPAMATPRPGDDAAPTSAAPATVGALSPSGVAGVAETAGNAGISGNAGQGGAQAASGTGELDSLTGLAVTQRQPVKGVRKVIGEAMTRSRTEIPEATVWVDVDATELMILRAQLKAQNPDNAPSLLALIARFVLAGLRKYPQLASRLDEHEDGTRSIAQFEGVNLGLAVESERGLLVPNLRNADRLSTVELNQKIREIIDLARSGKAAPADLSGSTFTLNNYGVFGTDGATPIINHPEVGILGIGRIIDRPWVVDGELTVRKITTLTLAFDHRVCDGGSAGGFLRFVADAVENPMSAFLHM